MRVLALRGAHVIGTARTLERGQEACASIAGQSDAGRARAQRLRLRRGVRRGDSRARHRRSTRCLQCRRAAHGAAAGARPRDAIRRQSLGHFILVNRLLDRVTAAPQGRVVVVGSVAHQQVPPGGIQFDNLSGQGWERQAYGHSKLANGLFSFELAKRLQGTRATSNSLHPGVVATNIMRNLNFTPPAGGGNRGGGGGGFTFEQPAQGAATSCYLASHPSLAGVTGLYFVDCNPAEPERATEGSGDRGASVAGVRGAHAARTSRSRRRSPISGGPGGRSPALCRPRTMLPATGGRSARPRSARQTRFRTEAIPRATACEPQQPPHDRRTARLRPPSPCVR